MSEMMIGDRVVYSSRFLRSIAEPATSPRWRDKGNVIGITDGWLAEVEWARDDAVNSTINVGNLDHIDRTVTKEEPPFECGDAWTGMGFRSLA